MIKQFSLLSSLLILFVMWTGCQSNSEKETEPETPSTAKVEVVQKDGRYQFLINDEPFTIHGAGLEFGSQEKLAAHNGNSFRTWRTDNGRESGKEVLDRALENGLYVSMGIEVGRERHGFDYNDTAAVAAQKERIRQEVLELKDHPALFVWLIGNELNLRATNPKVWDAVNDISLMIHELDPNHPTSTSLAGIGPELVSDIKSRAPDLDLLSIQMYGELPALKQMVDEAGWDGPYMVTEWGATGHWEVPATEWDAPIENTSSQKADFYLSRYNKGIRPDSIQCVGSYVFLWGQKQERTPTWYGIFLETGEETESVDVMHYIWNGEWPENRTPRLDSVSLDGKSAMDNIYIEKGSEHEAFVQSTDPDNDSLSYRWEIMHESNDLGDGGDFESTPPRIPGLIENPSSPQTKFRSPEESGAYRLFIYIFDGNDHAAHANIPFFVK